jgi:hypothetical protein
MQKARRELLKPEGEFPLCETASIAIAKVKVIDLYARASLHKLARSWLEL